jgi:hypothetical protein
MKPKTKSQKLTLSKQSISVLTDAKQQKINAGYVQKTTEGFTSVIACETEICCPTLSN